MSDPSRFVDPVVPSRRRRRGRFLRPGWLLLGGLALAGAGWGGWAWRRGAATGAAPGVGAGAGDLATAVALPPLTDSTANAPAATRVRVQVVNATTVRGLARRATRYLRDRGYDVVEVGTTGQRRDATLVLDRSGHREWAARVARAMGGAPVEARPDTSRYLDVTVLVGRSWRPPAEPFHP